MNYDLEDELRKALRRKEPSRDLMPPRLKAKRWENRWRWAVAAGALVAVLGTYEYREQQHAKNQLVVALRLAGMKLEIAQERVLAVEKMQ